ncbi:NAD(P)/FAD-dependent oxidoreductase [Miltoncostaea oceani]|uniref:NAD(P)/FAD-dependent oxidoreductase n=1 Tax=Miltoncostaea oceani TaxID=2843216 RepID=UPI001C3D8F5E|nr:FAD/NAD(P)-binding oxidoreductase [Miltoncostaea oceani]
MPAYETVVIVGGGPAGLAGARGYRAAGGTAPVVLLTADDRPPYRRPPLSKELLRGEIGEGDLPLAADGWYADEGIDVRCGTEVTGIDTSARVVVTGDGERLPYAACLIATGAEPGRPPVPGIDLPGVHVLRSARDALDLRAALPSGGRVVVVGSGFVGCEAAVSMAMTGARVTMVTAEAAPQVTRLGAAVGARLTSWLTAHGVSLRPGRPLTGVTAADGTLRVAAGRGATDADLVLVATGGRPRADLAERAGLRVEAGAVRTDASMRTSAAGVLCAGDVALADNPAAGRPLRVEHWGEALAQGEVAGRVMAGEEAVWDAVPGFWSTIGRRTLKQAAWGDGWDVDTVRDHGGGAFTAWYGRGGRIVGVLTHDRDDDYDRGSALVRAGAPWPPPPDDA